MVAGPDPQASRAVSSLRGVGAGPRSGHVRAAALLLTALTGASGLVYQVAWQKYLAVLLGSHAEATAAVLGIFLGGLSAGYWLLGRATEEIVRRAAACGTPPPLVHAYALVEGAIGLWALLFPLLFRVAQSLSLFAPAEPAAFSFALDILLTVLLIGPPTVLMGGTIPLLTQALSRDLDDASRLHARVYAFNTAGAFVGALAGGLLLVPWLGLRDCVLAMGGINLLAAAAFAWLGRSAPAVPIETEPEAKADAGAEAGISLARYALVAGLAGFSMMTLQTAANRVSGLALGASHFTFAMVVATFVFCIALGSFAVASLRRIPGWLLPASQWTLAVYLLALYPLVENAPFHAHRLRATLGVSATDFWLFQASIFGSGLVLLIVPLAISGATLPLLFHALRDRMGGLGGVAGRLYATNTLGSLLGALFGGYTLLQWLDLHHMYRLAILGVVASAWLLSAAENVREDRAARRLGASAFGVLLCALVLWQPAWRPERLSAGLFRHRTLLPGAEDGADAFFEMRPSKLRFYDDDPAVTASVAGTLDTGPLNMRTNGKTDGSIPGDNMTMGLLGLLPALFSEKAESAFVIGYGTGYTAGALAALETIQQVVVAEISPAVLRGGRFFESMNGAPLASPKVEIVVQDAFRALRRSDQRYDLIVSEPSHPWVTGVEMLFSREFLEATRDHLTPGGVYAHWFHVYESDDASVELVLRTFASVYPHVAVWQSLRSDLIILGFVEEPEPGFARIRERIGLPGYREQLRHLGIENVGKLLAHEALPLDVVHALGLEGPVHTILKPILSDRAARAFFVGGRGWLPRGANRASAEIGERNSLLGAYLRSAALSERHWFSLVLEACIHQDAATCATLFVDYERRIGASAGAKAWLAQRRREGNEHLSPGRLFEIDQRFSPDGGYTRRDPTAAAEARAVFRDYYHPAAPFSGPGLRRLFEECSAPACVAQRAAVASLGSASPGTGANP